MIKLYNNPLNYYTHINHLSAFVDQVFDDVIYSSSQVASIDETDEQYVVTLPLPGYKQSHLTLTVDNDTLIIEAKKDESVYKRRILLPTDIRSGEITAKLEDGLLNINIPKSLKAKPIKIEVK